MHSRRKFAYEALVMNIDGRKRVIVTIQQGLCKSLIAIWDSFRENCPTVKML